MAGLPLELEEESICQQEGYVPATITFIVEGATCSRLGRYG